MGILSKLFRSKQATGYQTFKHAATHVHNRTASFKHGTARTLRRYRRGKIK
jgi:hypothetical protein